MRTAVLLTAYNRPTLVVDAIESVLEQQPADWRLYVLDDGSDTETRNAIGRAIGRWPVSIINGGQTHRDGRPLGHGATWEHVVWWQGQDRTMKERKARISYSVTINLALNYLLSDEKYVTYVCDDDALLPDSLVARADYLDAHPDVSVVCGRLASVQYDVGGFNAWRQSIKPRAGRGWLVPDGERVADDRVGNARCYYRNGVRNPITGLGYVEEGFWQAGPFRYGEPHRCDHNQLLHRRACLDRAWLSYGMRLGLGEFHEYWPEANHWGVGDAGFFSLLARDFSPFVGVECWAAQKKFHAESDGVSASERRE